MELAIEPSEALRSAAALHAVRRDANIVRIVELERYVSRPQEQALRAAVLQLHERRFPDAVSSASQEKLLVRLLQIRVVEIGRMKP